jgi:hypothetical protein
VGDFRSDHSCATRSLSRCARTPDS